MTEQIRQGFDGFLVAESELPEIDDDEGALSGPLHGGANQDVMETLLAVDESDRGPTDEPAPEK